MGLGRVELPTSRLSGVRSNHLSYRPFFQTLRRRGPRRLGDSASRRLAVHSHSRFGPFLGRNSSSSPSSNSSSRSSYSSSSRSSSSSSSSSRSSSKSSSSSLSSSNSPNSSSTSS